MISIRGRTATFCTAPLFSSDASSRRSNEFSWLLYTYIKYVVTINAHNSCIIAMRVKCVPCCEMILFASLSKHEVYIWKQFVGNGDGVPVIALEILVCVVLFFCVFFFLSPPVPRHAAVKVCKHSSELRKVAPSHASSSRSESVRHSKSFLVSRRKEAGGKRGSNFFLGSVEDIL